MPCHTCCGHGRGRHKGAQRDRGYRNQTPEPGNTTWTRISPLTANLPRGRTFGVLFSSNGAGELLISRPNVFVCLPHLAGNPNSSSEVVVLIALQVISRAPLCCYLSSTVCRCGWDLTSIGFLMTVLFVRWVPPRKADVWQEIAVEEDWASCWAGLLSRCPVRSPSPLAFPPFSSLTPSPNCPL